MAEAPHGSQGRSRLPSRRWLHELDGRPIRSDGVDHARSGPLTPSDYLRYALGFPAIGRDPRKNRIEVVDDEGEVRKARVERFG